MAKKKTKSPIAATSSTVAHPPPALKIRNVLQGHVGSVFDMSFSRDGRFLASPGSDGRICIWDVESGSLLKSFEHEASIRSVDWSSDNSLLAGGGGYGDGKVYIWDVATSRLIKTIGPVGEVINSIAFSPREKILAIGSRKFYLTDPNADWQLREFVGHTYDVIDVRWSPDGQKICSASGDGPHPSLWDTRSAVAIWKPIIASSQGCSIAWSPQGDQIASSGLDFVIRLWDVNTGQEKFVLEGHTSPVRCVSFIDNGGLLASLGEGGTMIFWRTDTWTEVLRVDKIGETDNVSNFAVHPSLPLIAVRGLNPKEIQLWDLDLELLRGSKGTAATQFFVNAKAVLVGESGVGKSGLAIRIAEEKFRPTEGSTHGAQFWHFSTEQLQSLPPNVQGELTLWDLAGQAEYRLTHQLFLDDADAALLLFDCSDPNDPFRGVPYWAKVLKKHAPPHGKKFLVSARCDVSPVTVHDREINQTLALYGLDKYFKTSANTGEGVDLLFTHLIGEIPWDQLPRTSTPRLFQVLRDFLLESKQAGINLIDMKDIQQAAAARFTEGPTTQAQLDTVIQLLQSRGLVHRLERRPGRAAVLLKPEKINQYGACIIQAARNNSDAIGTVPERDVLTSNIMFAGFERLPDAEERLVLESTVELLIRHDLGFREMGYLVFPSQINITRHAPNEEHPRTEVAYQFSGSIETIYASLVVRLSYTDYFRREDQWKYAVEFSRVGNRLGFAMRQIEEGTGELEIYFQPGISAFDRVTFIRFITDHLRFKGIDIKEQIRLYCPNCSKEVTNREAIEARIRDRKLDIPCQFCDTTAVIPKSVEEIYQRDSSLVEKQKELVQTVEERTEAEVKQFRDDQQQYTTVQNQQINIIHLSDIHFGENTFADVWRTQLETDLKQELGIHRLEYLILSGDIANRSTEKEYDVAYAMIDGLVKRFGLDPGRVIIVPGNHDLNWDLSEASYPFVSKRKLPSPLPEDRHIPAGEAGALLRDESLYRERFANFSQHFYRRIYTGQDYPMNYADQALVVERPDDHILFLGLNSSWQLDHHFRGRASIHMQALSRALEQLQDGKYDGWLKVAIWHHPITGKEMMNDEFMQLLAVHEFQIVMHGHIHEASEGFYHYDDGRSIHIVGAGTFGAPADEQVTGIPLQYNLLTFDPKTSVMTVNTRKKEKPNGAWSADARWGDKNNPKPWYSFNVPNYIADEPQKD